MTTTNASRPATPEAVAARAPSRLMHVDARRVWGLAYVLVPRDLGVFPTCARLLAGRVAGPWRAGLAAEGVPGLRPVVGFGAATGHQSCVRDAGPATKGLDVANPRGGMESSCGGSFPLVLPIGWFGAAHSHRVCAA